MPTSITLHEIPDDVRDELAARAARSGHSLEEYLRGELIELTREPDLEALLARARERAARTGSRLSAARILEHRDGEHR